MCLNVSHFLLWCDESVKCVQKIIATNNCLYWVIEYECE